MTTQEFVINNRKKVAEKTARNSIILMHANDIMPTNADGTMPYKPNNDLYWLTGITQEETSLLLFPDHPHTNMREILFIKQVDEHFVKWHGRRLSLQEAREISGIENIQWQSNLKKVLLSLAVFAENIYLNTIEHPRSVNEVQTKDERFMLWCKQKFPLHTYKRLAPILGELRIVKSDYEIDLLRKACQISESGFRRILRFVKPGIKERLVEAELIHEYMQYNGDWADYQPIVASGHNTCILHYITNQNICQNGDLVLIDAAASYKLYNSDLTRTIPVNGRYSIRQKEVYNAVLSVHKAIKQFARASRYWQEIEDYSNELIIEQLLSLNLFSINEIKEKGRKYFIDKYNYHGFGHLLGLDVHDVGNILEKLPPNAAITVEPGIYIQEEGIGIRIENNVVLTPDGTMDLMAAIPIEAEEIEQLMNK